MTPTIAVSNVVFRPAPDRDLRDGVISYLSFDVNGLRVQATLRRTAAGAWTIGFPRRRDRNGRQHDLVAPINSEIRESIEQQVLEALARVTDRGGAP